MGIVERIREEISPGATIPKPKATKPFKVKGWGKRRGEHALIYLIPSHKNPKKPGEKGVTESEFVAAYAELMSTGEFTRSWFNENLTECNDEGSCSFTTIGGIFELLGLVEYEEPAMYRRIAHRVPTSPTSVGQAAVIPV